VIETTTSPGRWDDWCREVGLGDVYYDLRYLEIWETWEGGEAVGIRFVDALGTVLYPLLRRPLDALAGGAGAVDVRTAYDFGGPLAFGERPAELLAAFDDAWTQEARRWGVVSEFCRLHPFRCRRRPPAASFHADNYVLELSGSRDEVLARLHRSHLRDLRRARRGPLRARVERSPSPARVDAFAALYGETMERRGSDPFYRFPRRLLERLLGLDEVSLVAVDDAQGPVAMALFLASGRELFYFLSASSPRAARHTPGALLHDEARRFALAQRCERIHYGGGGEGVRRFKSRLADSKVPYYVVRRVHDPATYARLVSANRCEHETVFPAYQGLLAARRPGA
jgi:hypothetical protein